MEGLSRTVSGHSVFTTTISAIVFAARKWHVVRAILAHWRINFTRYQEDDLKRVILRWKEWRERLNVITVVNANLLRITLERTLVARIRDEFDNMQVADLHSFAENVQIRFLKISICFYMFIKDQICRSNVLLSRVSAISTASPVSEFGVFWTFILCFSLTFCTYLYIIFCTNNTIGFENEPLNGFHNWNFRKRKRKVTSTNTATGTLEEFRPHKLRKWKWTSYWVIW